jgi:hypothetical protein
LEFVGATGRYLVMRFAVLLAILLASSAHADPRIPAGFEEVSAARSPDGRYGVILPDARHVVDGVRQTRMIEVATGKLIATLDAETVFVGQSHANPAPQWTRDGKALVWHVEGKWGSRAVAVVRIDNGAVVWQVDVRERVVREVLRALERTAPRAYAIAKRQGQALGSWYRDGFAIDVRPVKPTAFPLTFEIELTSDPKCHDDYPKAGRIAYRTSARLDSTGKVVVDSLRARAMSCGM